MIYLYINKHLITQHTAHSTQHTAHSTQHTAHIFIKNLQVSIYFKYKKIIYNIYL